MHREIQDQIEQILSGEFSSAIIPSSVSAHLEQCSECRDEVASMKSHVDLLHEFRAPSGQVPEPRPGFYARVMERIEAEGPVSVWLSFMESTFGRRIAVASVALALVLGAYLVSSERDEEPMVAGQGVSQQLDGQLGAHNASAQQDAASDALPATPASASEFSTAVGGDDVSAQMMLQQQMLMQQMINQMDNAGSQDQVLVNLATYQEQ